MESKVIAYKEGEFCLKETLLSSDKIQVNC